MGVRLVLRITLKENTMIDSQKYKTLTVAQIRAGLLEKEFTAVELAQMGLELAESEGKALNCFITLCTEKALGQAKAVDAKIAAGVELGKLAGVPVALKDNMSYRDYPTTCASHILDGYIPPYDATVVEKLIAADAVIIGKTNMDEFAMGSSNENSYYGPAVNPVNNTCATGGSSGGSAAAVAAGITPLALGSDTGGSVRQPAAFCGVQGMKPTYGAVSRYGLIAFASSLDQIGPFARNSVDLAELLTVISGRDKHDSTSIDFEHPDYAEGIDESPDLMRIGWPGECFGEGVDHEVLESIGELRKNLEEVGHTFVDVSLSQLNAGIACYYVVATAEASSNLARFDGVKYGIREGDDSDLLEMYRKTRGKGFGAEVKRRIMLGTYVLSAGYYDAYYLKGMKVRQVITKELDDVFSKVDVLMTPTTPTPAFCMGDKLQDPLAMYLSDVFTVIANLAGTPGISIPAGRTHSGLPVGAQFLGKRFDDARLLKLAHQAQKLIQ